MNEALVISAIAPDRPAIAARLGMTLFLAGEAMFFFALLSSYFVLRSIQPALFIAHAAELNRTSASIAAILTIASSALLLIAGPRRLLLAAALVASVGFLCTVGVEWSRLLQHHTIVQREPRISTTQPVTLSVFDGTIVQQGAISRTLHGLRAPAPSGIDVHATTTADVMRLGNSITADHQLLNRDLVADVTDGPWKSAFFAWYFLTIGAHAVHVIALCIAIVVLLIRRSPAAVAITNTAVFSCFCSLVWLALLPLLYL